MAAARNTVAAVADAEIAVVAAIVEDRTVVADVAAAVGNSAATPAAAGNIAVVAAVGKNIVVRAAGGFCRYAYSDLKYRSNLYRYCGLRVLPSPFPDRFKA